MIDHRRVIEELLGPRYVWALNTEPGKRMLQYVEHITPALETRIVELEMEVEELTKAVWEPAEQKVKVLKTRIVELEEEIARMDHNVL